MRDPVSGCTYDLLYQDLKKFSKNGENFCKELMGIFQQSCTYNAWNHVSEEMESTADLHRKLGLAFLAEAIPPIRQIADEHNKKKKPLDIAVEKTGKLVVCNWNEQIKAKKKLYLSTKEYESLYRFIETNSHLATEKEKQKMQNRLKKLEDALSKLDEEYFNMNVAGHQIRLKWEATLKNCYQSIQELEKQRILVLCDILTKYHQHISSFGQTLSTFYRQIDQEVKKMDVEKDIQTLVEETAFMERDNKAEFLLADYFEEDMKNGMNLERRKNSIGKKLQRLSENLVKARKNKEGLEKMIATYNQTPSFSNKANVEEAELHLEEVSLKIDLLEANYYKLMEKMAESEGKPKLLHHYSDSILKWKDKDLEHSVVQISRIVKMRKSQSVPKCSTREPAGSSVQQVSMSCGKSTAAGGPNGEGAVASSEDDLSDFTEDETDCQLNGTGTQEIGTCKALYDYKSEREDELNICTGDLLAVHQKGTDGWWYGSLNSQRGYFPSTYVEELPQFNINKSSDA
ncbi:nostrin isoform X3 [Polypterus senegalus]|uniref:nostrin isoform X3 n=1 Tax=Polypterus senegalus TaxID=55291 RepID=UPI0019629BA6|nr:nostrin isoform X3 [Polypterus senegalus]